MSTGSPFHILSRGIYALFDGELIPGEVKPSVLQTFSEGISEITDISLDSEAQRSATAFNSLMNRIRNGDSAAFDEIQTIITEHLKSPDMELLYAEYYSQMIPVLFSAIPEEKHEEAHEILRGIGITEDLVARVHKAYVKMMERKSGSQRGKINP
ncbi:MAG: hypothetical protein PHG63_02895 [Candidatus Dojkabacteria bacterium]|nr:hypothetical protein [Candidatus Dojkabacteria bacterium]